MYICLELLMFIHSDVLSFRVQHLQQPPLINCPFSHSLIAGMPVHFPSQFYLVHPFTSVADVPSDAV